MKYLCKRTFAPFAKIFKRKKNSTAAVSYSDLLANQNAPNFCQRSDSSQVAKHAKDDRKLEQKEVFFDDQIFEDIFMNGQSEHKTND